MEASNDYQEGTLLIAWNAHSGWQHAVMDSLHKWISPQTYSCKLCQLTYGLAGPKETWKAFLNSLGRQVLFYHKDEFEAAGLQGSFPDSFPFIVSYDHESWQVIVGPEDLDKLDSLESLLEVLQNKLSPNA